MLISMSVSTVPWFMIRDVEVLTFDELAVFAGLATDGSLEGKEVDFGVGHDMTYLIETLAYTAPDAIARRIG